MRALLGALTLAFVCSAAPAAWTQTPAPTQTQSTQQGVQPAVEPETGAAQTGPSPPRGSETLTVGDPDDPRLVTVTCPTTEEELAQLERINPALAAECRRRAQQ